MRYRKIANQIVVAAALQLGFVSCMDDLMTFTQKAIHLNAGMEAPAGTRAGLAVQSTNFDPSEQINIYIKGVDEDGTEVVYPGVFTTGSVNPNTMLNPLTYPEPIYYPDGDEKVNIQAYYPVWVTKETDKFTVEYTQGNDETGERNYKNSDLMYAERLAQEKTSGDVNLLFNHKLVKFVFNVEGDGDGVTIGDPYLTEVERAVMFDPATGAVSNYTDANKDLGDVLLDKGGAIIIPPQTIGGKFIGISMSSVRDGEEREGTAIFSLDTPKTLIGGKVYTVNIVLGHDNISKNQEDGTDYVYPITKWDDDAGVISIAPAGTTGISVADVDDVVYDYGNAFEPTPQVKFGEHRVLKSPADYPADEADYEYQYFNNIHGGKAIVLVVGKGDYMGFSVATSFTINPAETKLKYNSGTEEWADTEGKEADKVTMAYTYNGKVDNPLVEDVGEVTKVYNSSNEAVATVDQGTGVVTVVGVGTTTISVVREASTDWTRAEASYELTVTGRSVEDGVGASEVSVDLDQGGKTYVYDGTTEWKPSVTVKDQYTEGGATKETTVPAEYYTVEYKDPVSANEAAQVVVTFKEGAPYTGSITKTYKIAKANSNLEVTTSDMYIALPTNTDITEANRSRTVSVAFGNVDYKYYTDTDATLTDVESNPYATINGSNSQLTITGVAEGDFTLNMVVADDDNWNGSTKKINVHVVKSLFDYSYTGYSQRWVCPASGTYLLEVWGGQGGSLQQAVGGYGAQVEGRMSLKKDQVLYVNVGQQGLVAPTGYCPYSNPSSTNPSPGQAAYVREPYKAWNGGGALVWGLSHGVGTNVPWWIVGDPITGGGGATDISLDWKDYNTTSISSNTNWNTPEHLLTRIIVAGGGGGAHYYQRETGTANGTSGGAWEAGTMAITGNMTDPGEGGKINRGGIGGVALKDRTTYASVTAAYDGRPTGWSGSDGIFGDGGYWYCVEEGGGAGGGGWYGGGSCGQSSANGSGAGGSSYAWTDAAQVGGKSLSTYYPTASGLANSTYYKMYQNSTVNNPNQDARGFTKLTTASAKENGNGTDNAGKALDGKARITCVSITD